MNVCPFCGEPVPYGHRCTCKQSRSLFAKELFDKHYGKETKDGGDVDKRPDKGIANMRKRKGLR